jgi:hypothetical protein
MIEEEFGEDGLELDSEHTETDPDAPKPKFELEESKINEDPKYSPFQKWKWYTITFQSSLVLQLCILSMWFLDAIIIEEMGLKTQSFPDKIMHIVPTVCVSLEFFLNSQPMVDRHYWTTTVPLILASVIATILVELETPLYIVDQKFGPITLPLYPLVCLAISIPLFYLMKLATYLKLEVQGYPCDKILEEMDLQYKKERQSHKIDIEREIVPIKSDQVRSELEF